MKVANFKCHNNTFKLEIFHSQLLNNNHSEQIITYNGFISKFADSTELFWNYMNNDKT